MTVRLLIFVQEVTFADALAARLDAEPDIEVMAAPYLRELLPQLPVSSRADLVLLDGDLPGSAVFLLCEELRRRGDTPKIISLQNLMGELDVHSALGAVTLMRSLQAAYSCDASSGEERYGTCSPRALARSSSPCGKTFGFGVACGMSREAPAAGDPIVPTALRQMGAAAESAAILRL